MKQKIKGESKLAKLSTHETQYYDTNCGNSDITFVY